MCYSLVNKFDAPKRKTGYQSIDHRFRKKTIFHFPIKKADLNKQWIRFANRINWESTQHLSFVSFILKNISSVALKDVI